MAFPHKRPVPPPPQRNNSGAWIRKQPSDPFAGHRNPPHPFGGEHTLATQCQRRGASYQYPIFQAQHHPHHQQQQYQEQYHREQQNHISFEINNSSPKDLSFKVYLSIGTFDYSIVFGGGSIIASFNPLQLVPQWKEVIACELSESLKDLVYDTDNPERIDKIIATLPLLYFEANDPTSTPTHIRSPESLITCIQANDTSSSSSGLIRLVLCDRRIKYTASWDGSNFDHVFTKQVPRPESALQQLPRQQPRKSQQSRSNGSCETQGNGNAGAVEFSIGIKDEPLEIPSRYHGGTTAEIIELSSDSEEEEEEEGEKKKGSVEIIELDSDSEEEEKEEEKEQNGGADKAGVQHRKLPPRVTRAHIHPASQEDAHKSANKHTRSIAVNCNEPPRTTAAASHPSSSRVAALPSKSVAALLPKRSDAAGRTSKTVSFSSRTEEHSDKAVPRKTNWRHLPLRNQKKQDGPTRFATEEEHHAHIKRQFLNSRAATIFDLLLRYGPLTRKELAAKIGVNDGSHNFFYSLREIKQSDYVEEDPRSKGYKTKGGGTGTKLRLSDAAFLDPVNRPQPELDEQKKLSLENGTQNKSNNADRGGKSNQHRFVLDNSVAQVEANLSERGKNLQAPKVTPDRPSAGGTSAAQHESEVPPVHLEVMPDSGSEDGEEPSDTEREYQAGDKAFVLHTDGVEYPVDVIAVDHENRACRVKFRKYSRKGKYSFDDMSEWSELKWKHFCRMHDEMKEGLSQRRQQAIAEEREQKKRKAERLQEEQKMRKKQKMEQKQAEVNKRWGKRTCRTGLDDLLVGNAGEALDQTRAYKRYIYFTDEDETMEVIAKKFNIPVGKLLHDNPVDYYHNKMTKTKKLHARTSIVIPATFERKRVKPVEKYALQLSKGESFSI